MLSTADIVKLIQTMAKKSLYAPIAPPPISPETIKKIIEKSYLPTRKVEEGIGAGLDAMPQGIRDALIPPATKPWQPVLQSMSNIAKRQQGPLSYRGAPQITDMERDFQKSILQRVGSAPVDPMVMGSGLAYGLPKPWGIRTPAITPKLPRNLNKLSNEQLWTNYKGNIGQLRNKLTPQRWSSFFNWMQKNVQPFKPTIKGLLTKQGGVRIPDPSEITALARKLNIKLNPAQVKAIARGVYTSLPPRLMSALKFEQQRPTPSRGGEIEGIPQDKDLITGMRGELESVEVPKRVRTTEGKYIRQTGIGKPEWSKGISDSLTTKRAIDILKKKEHGIHLTFTEQKWYNQMIEGKKSQAGLLPEGVSGAVPPPSQPIAGVTPEQSVQGMQDVSLQARGPRGLEPTGAPTGGVQQPISLQESIKNVPVTPAPPPSGPTALTTEGFFKQKFKEPTMAKFFTPQWRYPHVLGLQDILGPSVEAKAKMLVERQRITQWMGDLKHKLLKGTSFKEKTVSKLKNVPTAALERMWDYLNTPGLTAEEIKNPVDKEVFTPLRELTESMFERVNKVIVPLGLEPIRHLDGYVTWIYQALTNKAIKEKYPISPDIEYWINKIRKPKHVFNPTALERTGKTEGLLKDPFKALKAMVSADLKQIFLEAPSILYREHIKALKDIMPELTRVYAEEFMHNLIKENPASLDKLTDSSLAALKIPQIMDKILAPLGRTWGPRSIDKIASGVGRLIHDANIWGRIKLVFRNHTQKGLPHGLYGTKAFAKAFLPESPELKSLIDNSTFYQSSKNTYMETMPKDMLGWLERIGYAPYAHSHAGRVGGNVPFSMKAAYHASKELVDNPKYAKYGWTMDDVAKEMDYGAATTQYWYNLMGMPELYRHKVLGMFAKFQSWWMNYTFSYWREMLHRGFTGKTGWGKPIPPKWRVAALRHIIGSLTFIEGARRAFGLEYKQIALLGVLPTYLSPVGQVALGLIQLATAKTDWQKTQAKYTLGNSYKAFIPGSGAWRDVAAVWSGEKPLKSLLFHTTRESGTSEFSDEVWDALGKATDVNDEVWDNLGKESVTDEVWDAL